MQNPQRVTVNLQELDSLLAAGLSRTEIAARLHVSKPTLYKLMKENGLFDRFKYELSYTYLPTLKVYDRAAFAKIVNCYTTTVTRKNKTILRSWLA